VVVWTRREESEDTPAILKSATLKVTLECPKCQWVSKYGLHPDATSLRFDCGWCGVALTWDRETQ